MFETLAINFRDQGQGGAPWDEDWTDEESDSEEDLDLPHEDWTDHGDKETQGDDQDRFVIGDESNSPNPSDFEEGEPIEGDVEEHPEIAPPAGSVQNMSEEELLQHMFGGGMPEEGEPIEHRTSEAEKLYANLLMKTDFERGFIEEMLEFEPDEESEMRIDELRRKRREMEELAGNMGGLPPAPPQGTTTILI